MTPLQKTLRWGLWWVALSVWTVLLLSPRAPHAVAVVVGDSEAHFWVSKAAHVCGYAVLSILVGFLPVGKRSRIAWWLFLVFHGGMTEYIQQFVGRHASVRDVGLDLAGITLGLAVLWMGRRLQRG